MTAIEIINQLEKDRVQITLSTSGKIQVTGEQKAVSFWVPLVRENKAAIVQLLKKRAVPNQCHGCNSFEVLSDMEPGCVVKLPEDSEWKEEWRQLRNVTKCPMGKWN